jgi:hypothetical protein
LRSFQRLTLALLVAAQHHRTIWRVQVQPDHVPELLLKVNVVGQFERASQVGPNIVSPPQTLNRRRRHARRSFADAARAVDAVHARHPPPLAPKIYDRDDYHVYCLTKLLAERLVLERGGVVLRLCNVYGPGDESAQAVGEACRRILAADPDVEAKVNQPFKKLVPTYLGDIVRCLVRASTWPRAAGRPPGDADLSIAFARPLTAGRSGGSGTSRRG